MKRTSLFLYCLLSSACGSTPIGFVDQRLLGNPGLTSACVGALFSPDEPISDGEARIESTLQLFEFDRLRGIPKTDRIASAVSECQAAMITDEDDAKCVACFDAIGDQIYGN
jgi:hypothetical protein